MLEHLISDVEAFVRADGAVAVAVVLFLEALGAPVPGESMLVFSGVMAGKGELSPWALLPAAWLGTMLGGAAGYAIGRFVGRTTIIRYGARVGLTHERWGRVETTFARYGIGAVVVARFVNVLRQLNGIVAGGAGMAPLPFLVANAVGAALWVTLWAGGAYLFGDALGREIATLADAAEAAFRSPLAWIATAVVAAGALYLFVRWRQARRGA